MDFLLPVFFITCIRKISKRIASPFLNYMEHKVAQDNLVFSPKQFILHTTSNFNATRSIIDSMILDWKCKAKLNCDIPNTLIVKDLLTNLDVELIKLSLTKPVVLNIGSAT